MSGGKSTDFGHQQASGLLDLLGTLGFLLCKMGMMLTMPGWGEDRH